MFCLRSWLPLLFIPTNASPAFIFLFFVGTYFLNRPCFYCSVLLLVLFLTSCNWSDRCFFDLGNNWSQTQPSLPSRTTDTSPALNGSCAAGQDRETSLDTSALEMLGATAAALSGAALDELARQRAEWAGLGMEWLRSLLGRQEWRIDCLDVYIRP